MGDKSKNVFAVCRSLQKDEALWLRQPFTYGQAWVDLIGHARYSDGYMIYKSEDIFRQINVYLLRGEIGWSERSLAKRWKWSRNKVRRFLSSQEKKGSIERIVIHEANNSEAGRRQKYMPLNERETIPAKGSPKKRGNHVIRITNYERYQFKKGDDDTSSDTSNDTSSDTNSDTSGDASSDTQKNKGNKGNKVNKGNKGKPIPASKAASEGKYLLSKKKRKLTGVKLEWFTLFWDAFERKIDRANAIDTWLLTQDLSESLVREKILPAAKREAKKRPDLPAGRTAIYPQGWLSGRRWEDEAESAVSKKTRAPFEAEESAAQRSVRILREKDKEKEKSK